MNPCPFPTRPYGQTGIQLSIIGMGGIVLMGNEQPRCNDLVAEFVDRGINYFDVAPQYGDGEAEIKMGPALAPHRDKVFLACKTLERDRAGADYELNRSLERLKTDHFDLYQLHSLSDMEKDVDRAFGKGGAIETLIEARRSGRVRHLGFSAHSEEAALAAMDRFDFDSILFPVNFANILKGAFGPRVLEAARKRGLAILALKGMARGRWAEDDPGKTRFEKCWYEPLSEPREMSLALRYTLSQPIAAAIPPGEEPLFRQALEIAQDFEPLNPEEVRELSDLAEGLEPVFSA